MSAKKILIVALAVVYGLLLFDSGAWAWQRYINIDTLGNRFENSFAKAVAVDAAGNVVVAGSTGQVCCYSAGFVIKFDGLSGAELWRQFVGFAGDDSVNAIALDSAGNVVAAGYTLASCTNQCFYNFNVTKFDGVSGAELWRKDITGMGNGYFNWANAVAIDTAGNVVAAGLTETTGGTSDFTVIKFDGVSGAVLWRKDTIGAGYANAVTVDGSGNVVAAGATLSVDYSDFTVVRFDGATGVELWRKQINGIHGGYDYANALAVDGAGNVVAAGATSDVVNGVGDESFTVIKFDGASGAELWRKVVVQSEGTGWSSGWANSVAVDFANNVVAAGHSHTSNIGTFSDFAVVKFDGASGAELWRNMIHSGANDVANAVAPDALGNVVAAGFTQNPNTGIDFTVIKFDGANGQEMWRQVINGTGNGVDLATAVAVDAARNVIAAGSTSNAAGESDLTVVKLPAMPTILLELTADLASPQNLGMSIAFTATATNGIAPLEYKWWVFNGAIWSVVKDWSMSNHYSWTPGLGGSYRIGVWVRSSGNSTDWPEGNAYTSIAFDINPPRVLTITGLTADSASPQPAGTSITFSATTSGGLAPHQYKWWVFNGSVWSVVKDWSTSSSFTWTSGIGGSYRIGVWVKSSGNPVDYPEGNAFTSIAFDINPPPSLMLTGLTADQASPQPAGSTLTFTATTNGGLAPHQYKWWVFNGTAWSVVKDWSTSSSFIWTAGLGGNYRIGVWVKSTGNPVDYPEGNANASIAFDISPPPGLMLTGINSDQVSPQPIGSTITFTAATTGGLAPLQYKWWVYNGVVWSVVKDWSASNNFNWTPGLGGNYLVGVWVKSNLNPVDAPEGNAYNSIPFTINGMVAACVGC